MAQINPGTYRIENEGFNENPKRVLDLKGSCGDPGTPIICYPNNNTSNQKWSVTEFEGGYNFQALKPYSNAFINNVGPGVSVTTTPLQRTPLKLREAGPNQTSFRIIAESDSGHLYAFEASTESSKPVTLKHLDDANKYQKWSFHKLT